MLGDYFSKYGEVVDAFFIRKFPARRSAFIEFKNHSSVEKAIKQIHFFGERDLSVGLARHRTENSHKQPRSLKAKTSDFKVLRYRPY
jgi:RNA recognition motif-containing protein